MRYPPVRRQQPPVSERGFDRSCALLLLVPDSLTGCSLSLSTPTSLRWAPIIRTAELRGLEHGLRPRWWYSDNYNIIRLGSWEGLVCLALGPSD